MRFRRVSTATVLFSTLAILAGCNLFAPAANEDEAEQTAMREAIGIESAIRLDVTFLERPTGDVVFDRSVWTEVDQISALDAGIRMRLKRHGFRIGVGGSSPGQALSGLLADAATAPGSVHSFLRRPGEPTEIEVAPAREELLVHIPEAGGARSKIKAFRNARCVLRVEVESLQQGWATVVVTPEIHHGEMTTRRVATQSSFTLKSSQEVERLYPLKFEVSLSVGEMALVSATPRDANLTDEPVGWPFFAIQRDGEPRQRLLLLRLAETDLTDQVTIERETPR